MILHPERRGPDVHEVVEQTHAALDAWLERAGYVEVEVVVGEEPEEGVPLELTPVRGPMPSHCDQPSWPPGLW